MTAVEVQTEWWVQYRLTSGAEWVRWTYGPAEAARAALEDFRARMPAYEWRVVRETVRRTVEDW